MEPENRENESAVDRAHRLLIERILDGTYPVGAELPGERTLSKELGVARNALREAFQRMSHNGWLEIHHGRATRVRDYLRDGSLAVLMDLLAVDAQPISFVPDLMRMWALLAFDYTAAAARNEPSRIIERLALYRTLADTPDACVTAMWQLHRVLIDYGHNMAYALLFNNFAHFYERAALRYYQDREARQRARDFWGELHELIAAGDADTAAERVQSYIQTASENWTDFTGAFAHQTTHYPETEAGEADDERTHK